MKFRNLKEAHEYYAFPGSHRHGTIIDRDNGWVIRSYSAHDGKDRYYDDYAVVEYQLKNERIRKAFGVNLELNRSLYVFIRMDGWVYGSKYRVINLGRRYVRLENIYRTK